MSRPQMIGDLKNEKKIPSVTYASLQKAAASFRQQAGGNNEVGVGGNSGA